MRGLLLIFTPRLATRRTQHCYDGEVSEKFPKADRILKRDLFRRVYEEGRKIQARYFIGVRAADSGESGRA